MAFSKGKRVIIDIESIKNKYTDAQLVAYYLNINSIPCVINSPLRRDKHPSFGLYSTDGKRINWVDLATSEKGDIFNLLSKLWGVTLAEVIFKIDADFSHFNLESNISKLSLPSIVKTKEYTSNSKLECKIRSWEDYDIEYWESYGINVKWLKYADVYPVEYKIVLKDNNKFIFKADKYAYAYVEHKEGRVSLKIYQPFNTNGYKWSNNHDGSVISLWTKIPKEGDIVVICSSLKDALCLWINTGIPALAVQGEGYQISDTAINQLRSRYKKIAILFDNDGPGIIDGVKLASRTGFLNIVLPQFKGGKDISDYYKIVGKEIFSKTIKNLIIDNKDYDLPF